MCEVDVQVVVGGLVVEVDAQFVRAHSVFILDSRLKVYDQGFTLRCLLYLLLGKVDVNFYPPNSRIHLLQICTLTE